jgi:hypothetical protein
MPRWRSTDRLRRDAARLAPVGLAAVAAVLAAPAGARAAAREPAMWSVRAPAGGGARPLHDVLLRSDSLALRGGRAAAGSDVYRTRRNEPLRVILSPAFVPNRAAVQSFVDFMGSRLHGRELSRLTVYLAPLSEIAARCAPGAIACYAPSLQLLIGPGENTGPGEFTKEFAVTHEYGHHIARNRSNSPWSALQRGPKRWGTFHHVCQRVAARQLFPGDEGAQYAANPGEAWAQAYAFYHYPTGQPWQFTPLLAPVPGTRPAIRGDVLSPWPGETTVIRRGSFAGAGTRVATRSFATPLDGRVTFALSGPSAANLDLEVVVDGRVAGSSRRAGSREFIAGDLCGVRRIAVRVTRLRGAGPFRLVARIP